MSLFSTQTPLTKENLLQNEFFVKHFDKTERRFWDAYWWRNYIFSYQPDYVSIDVEEKTVLISRDRYNNDNNLIIHLHIPTVEHFLAIFEMMPDLELSPAENE